MSHPPAIIEAGAVYAKAELRRRLRWSESAWRSAVRAGLPVHRQGRQIFVLGDEFLAFIRSRPTA